MPTKISREKFDLACAFVKTNGRKLDAALLDRALVGGNELEIAAELSQFQNADGGFGHGLEPDLRTPTSTAIATSIAAEHMETIGLGDEHSMVKSTIRYLLETVDRGRWAWPIVTKRIDDAPHAPWWNYSENLAEEWNQFRFNPTAVLVGFLYSHRALLPADVLKNLAEAFLNSLRDVPNPTSYYDIRCSANLYESAKLPDELRAALKPWLLDAVAKLDPSNEHVNYFELVPNPQVVVAGVLRDRLEMAAERAIATQLPSGAWEPWWDWSEVSPTEWQLAAQEWRGVLTRLTIASLFKNNLVE